MRRYFFIWSIGFVKLARLAVNVSPFCSSSEENDQKINKQKTVTVGQVSVVCIAFWRVLRVVSDWNRTWRTAESCTWNRKELDQEDEDEVKLTLPSTEHFVGFQKLPWKEDFFGASRSSSWLWSDSHWSAQCECGRAARTCFQWGIPNATANRDQQWWATSSLRLQLKRKVMARWSILRRNQIRTYPKYVAGYLFEDLADTHVALAVGRIYFLNIRVPLLKCQKSDKKLQDQINAKKALTAG